jgi:hypothetical protein
LANTETGFTPYCLATYLNSLGVLQVLIQYNADINRRMTTGHPKFGGWSPLMFATRVGSGELIQHFTDLGAMGTSPEGIPNVMDVARTTLPPDEQDDLGLGDSYALKYLSTFCCAYCGVTKQNLPNNTAERLRRCAGCSTYYCSKHCQTADWRVRHKVACIGA